MHNPLERIANLEQAVDTLRREIAWLHEQLGFAPGRATDVHTQDAPFTAPAFDTPAELPPVPISRSPLEGPPAFDSDRGGAASSGSGAGGAPDHGFSGVPDGSGAPWRAAPRLGDFEAIVGRYGMLALATVAALAAVGTFLGWAIAHGLFGPTIRLGLGVVAATATALGGYRLRRRERSFGSILLGLALAMYHVCAWASGPLLRVVPPWVALCFATAISVALAVYAYHEKDEPLWCVGFGGAAIAPFVTSSGSGSALLLAIYGAVVLLSSVWALDRVGWWIAERVLGLAVGLYVAALASMPEREWGPLLALAIPTVVAIVAGLVSAPAGRMRVRLRAMGVLMVLAAIGAGFQSSPPLDRRLLGAAVAAAGVVWLLLLASAASRSEHTTEPGGTLHSFGDWLDASWLSLGFVVAIVAAFSAERAGSTVILVVATLAFVAFLASRPFSTLRDAAVFSATVSALAGAATYCVDAPLPLTVTAAGLGVVFALACRVWPSRVWLAMSAVTLLACSSASFQFLGERVAYEYVPFGTRATLVAVAITAAWGAMAWLARPLAISLAIAAHRATDTELRPAAGSTMTTKLVGATRGVAVVFPYLWVNLEIAHAFTPAVATLLLISYYASTGVITVWIGRRRQRAWLRHTGLALAVLAALVAFSGARGLDAIALRIAGYLVTAIFLLGIAYWYRGRTTA